MILVTLMMDAMLYFETSVLTRATRPNIPEDGVVHSHRRENLKSYKVSSNQLLAIETSFLTRGKGRHFPEDLIVHSHRREDLEVNRNT
jgi:hypothetical protein